MIRSCSTCKHTSCKINEPPCVKCFYRRRLPKWEPGLGMAEEHQRPSFWQIYMKLAHELSRRSTCRRLQVGCVITSTDFRKVLSIGYNGNASGQANDCDSEEAGACGCLHAEENAVINCDSPRYVEKIVFCTHLPCPMCAKRFINLGNVRTVYYDHDYRLRGAVDILNAAAITVTQFHVDGH